MLNNRSEQTPFEKKRLFAGIYRKFSQFIPSDESLQALENFSKNLIQHSAIGTFVIDSNHKVMLWNKACEELTGVMAADVVGTDNHWKSFYEYKRPCLADILIDGDFAQVARLFHISGKSTLLSNGLHAEGWYPNLGGKRRYIIFDAAPIRNDKGEVVAAIETLQDITNRKLMEEERERLISKLQEVQSKLKILSGLLPICSACKKIRDDNGYWNQLEDYISKHSEADFTHGICPGCARKLYPDVYK